MEFDRSSVLVLGIGGITCSFKSTLAKNLKRMINREYPNVIVEVVHQDEYYLPMEQVPYIPELNHYDYECPQSLRIDDFTRDVETLMKKYSSSDLDDKKENRKAMIIVEGIMIFHHQPLRRLINKCYFTFGTYDECKRARDTRTDYIPPDVPGYFDGYIWPAVVRYEDEARSLANEFNVEFLHMNSYEKNLTTIGLGVRKWLDRDWVLLTNDQLDVQQAVRFVTEPSDGAVALFCGVTRNVFEGKTVVHLEYEAYDSMAYSEMRKLCTLLRTKWKGIDRVTIQHRFGIVPVMEASVLIAISSPHRGDAQAACTFAIDTLKATVPIWKKEIYSDGTGTWKENSHCCTNQKHS